jgi:hypothetical protein
MTRRYHDSEAYRACDILSDMPRAPQSEDFNMTVPILQGIYHPYSEKREVDVNPRNKV